MDAELVKAFEIFVERLKQAKATCLREDFIKKYDHVIEMTDKVINDGILVKSGYDALSRYVSDCLPWTEPILESWNKIRRLVRTEGY